MKKGFLHKNRLMRRIYAGVSAVCLMFASDGMSVSAANFEVAAAAGIDSVLEGAWADDEEIDEADPDEFVTGAGVELIIGSIDSMTKQDFEDMMENLEIIEEEEQKENWGYENLGVADVSENLNVRRAAGTDAEKVGELPAGAGCEILDTANGWAHIRSGAVEGYVSMDYLATGERAEELAEQNQTLTATVLAQALKVRKQPDTDHGTWGLVANGRELEVVEVLENGWVSVVYGDGTDAAYVSGEYVDVAYRLETALTMTEVRYGKGVTDAGIDLANRAIQYVGRPYVYGGTSLSNGTDCSGFTMLLYAKYGISLSHSARAQARCGSDVPISQLRPGDLVFYSRGGGIDHVAIYIGGGQVCHASNPTNGIIITSVNYRTPVCARRLL